MKQFTLQQNSFLLSTLLIVSSKAIAVADEPIALPGLTVSTAVRAEQPAADVLASVSAITREDIRRSAAQDLLELLRLQAGVDIVRSGPSGAQTSVFLRGGNSDHVLVLIDGIRVASAHTGTYAWELLPLSQIERIEIVRGPRAALYGSDAIGGVIQVITRQLESPAVRLTGGSYGTAEAEAGLGFLTGAGRHSLNAAWRRADGFSAQNPGGFSYDPDDDGFESRSFGLSGEGSLSGGGWTYRVLASESETEFDQGVSEASQWLAVLGWSGQATERWSYRLNAGYFDDELESDYIFFTSGFASQRVDLNWHNALDLARGRLAFGLDFIDESGRSDNSYRADRDNRAAYAVWDLPAGPADLQLGGRLDDNNQFGSEWTWQAAVGIDTGATGRLGGQLGTAFRAPDLGEQFSPGFGGFFAGNPALQPETSRSAELSYRHGLGENAHIGIAAYNTEVDRLIAFTGVDFQAVNINQARMRGIELEFGLRTDAWIIQANTTLQDTEDKSTGESLLRRPDHKGTLAIDRLWARGGWLGFEAFISGERLDFGGQSLSGYSILSLRGGMPLNHALTLELRLENLLDEDYEPAAGFNSAGRSAFLSLDWRP
jgi:vitamin B12 transporter